MTDRQARDWTDGRVLGVIWGRLGPHERPGDTVPLAESPEPLSPADSSPQPKPSDETLSLFGGGG